MLRMIAPWMIGLAMLSACTEEVTSRPPVEVVTDTVALDPYQRKFRYVGRLQAVDDVAIQARVTGYLLSREFTEGQLVHSGDILYTLDASEYEAALARANADMSAAVAKQANAMRNFKRGQELLPHGAISQSEMDDLTTRTLDADAKIESSQAQITSAEVNLGYTRIIAPITGRIGSSAASPGDLVGPTSGNLTTLVSIDPIQATFQISEATYVSAIGSLMSEGFDAEALSRIEVSVELTNGKLYSEIGRIDYFANRIDQNTGTLHARAKLPNPNSELVPGQYVRVILRDPELLEGLFIPQAAVQDDQQGSYVLTVDSEGMVARSNVELGERRDDKVLTASGVAEGDNVIVRGLQKVRPGMKVDVKSLPATKGQG